MKHRKNILRIAIAAIVILAVSLKADTVIEPLRTFGFGDIQDVAVSPDHRHLATAGQSGAFLWDYESGAARHRLKHGWAVSTVAFSSDSRTLLTAGADRIVRAWDTESGKEIRSFTGHDGEILHISFAPDGRSFVSGSADNTARVWSLETGQQMRQVRVPGSFIHAAEFTVDGKALVTAANSSTGPIQLWDLESESVIRTFPEPSSHVRALAMLAGNRLVSAGDDLRVKIWDLETGQLSRSLQGATLSINSLGIVTNSSTLTAACQDGRLVSWNFETGEVLHNVQGEFQIAACPLPGVAQVITADRDYVLRVREMATAAVVRTIEGHSTSTTTGVAFSPDGQYVLSGGNEADTRLWGRADGRLIRKFKGHAGGTATVSFSADGAFVLTTRGSPKPSAQLWNTESGELIREFSWDSGWPTSAALSKDGNLLAAGVQDGKVHVWSVLTGSRLHTLTGRAGWITSTAFSPDGKWLATGGSSYKPIVDLWDVSTGESLWSYELEAGSVKALSFSSSGSELLAAWEDGFARVLNPATGEFKREIIVPAAFLNAALFSPGDDFILTGEGWPFFTATLWDAKTGESLRTFSGHTWSVDSIAFNAAGTSILTGSDSVRLWSIADVAAGIQSQLKPEGLELRWRLGALYQAPTLGGPWEEVPYARSPWIVPADETAGFFRTEIDVQ